jgi:hypothetical protein
VLIVAAAIEAATRELVAFALCRGYFGGSCCGHRESSCCKYDRDNDEITKKLTRPFDALFGQSQSVPAPKA